jgi:hypothetical protein
LTLVQRKSLSFPFIIDRGGSIRLAAGYLLLLGDDACDTVSRGRSLGDSGRSHTLNLGHALLENLLQGLGALQLLLDLGNDGLSKLPLLALLDLALVTDPRVEDSLGLGGKGGLLLELISLSLELGGLL